MRRRAWCLWVICILDLKRDNGFLQSQPRKTLSEMMNLNRFGYCLFVATVLFSFSAVDAQSGSAKENGSATKGSSTQADAGPQEVSLAGGQLTLSAPGAWEKVQPRSRILEAELKVAASAEGEKDGRITIMRAGGSIPANIARWEGQFAGSGGDVEAATEVEEVAGKKVHFVDLTGTFQDSMGGGPFAGGKKVARENYRMSAAIVETGDLGNYFFKFIGPKTVVDAAADSFKDMIRSMKLGE